MTHRCWEPRGYNKSIDTVSLTAICLSTTFMFQCRGHKAYRCTTRRAQNAWWNHTFWTSLQLTEHLLLYINGLWYVIRVRSIPLLRWPKPSTWCLPKRWHKAGFSGNQNVTWQSLLQLSISFPLLSVSICHIKRMWCRFHFKVYVLIYLGGETAYKQTSININ